MEKYQQSVSFHVRTLKDIYTSLPETSKTEGIKHLESELNTALNPVFSEVVSNARRLQIQLMRFGNISNANLTLFLEKAQESGYKKYHTNLYSETKYSALNVPAITPKYGLDPQSFNGYQILNTYFDALLEERPEVIAFGEDVGQIGDVNQGFAGLQIKHGKESGF